MRTFCSTLGALASLATALALVGSSGVPAAAQVPPPRPILIVKVSDSPDPAASTGQVVYAILVKNDGTTKARNVVVTIPMPAGTAFVKCTMVLIEGSASTPCAPGLANAIVTANLGNIRAHKQPRITLTLTMPSVPSPPSRSVTVSAKANGDDVTDEGGEATTTVLPVGSFVTYLPSGRVGPIACGDTLTPEAFDTDTTAQLSGLLGCTSGPWGLRITASGKTLDLNKKGILWNAPPALGNVGILVSNAIGVTIIGGNLNDPNGISFFDWCVKDEGQSKKLTINSLRCYKARTAGIDITSKNVQITGVKVDRVAGTATTTAEPPGGVGIRTRGDQVHIKDSRVLKASTVGIWVAGSDTDGNGVVAQIDGNTSTMKIENSAGIGLLLDGGPHTVKDVYVAGDYYDRDTIPPVEGKNGVVVGLTGVDNLLDGVVVKQYAGHGFVVDGIGTRISRSNVDGVGLDGFVVRGADATISGNGVQHARHGFIVTGLDADLESNGAEALDGDGFVVDGDTPVLAGNNAKGNAGRGFSIGGDSGLLDTNLAEMNGADGFVVTGSGHTLKSNKSTDNAGRGFFISGRDSRLNSNTAERNASSEWVIGANNFDDGNNRKSGAVFTFTSSGFTSLD